MLQSRQEAYERIPNSRVPEQITAELNILEQQTMTTQLGHEAVAEAERIIQAANQPLQEAKSTEVTGLDRLLRMAIEEGVQCMDPTELARRKNLLERQAARSRREASELAGRGYQGMMRTARELDAARAEMTAGQLGWQIQAYDLLRNHKPVLIGDLSLWESAIPTGDVIHVIESDGDMEASDSIDL